jgi:MFS family permease
MGVVILIPAWAWLPPPDTSALTNSGTAMVDTPPSQSFTRLFMLAYFCAGVGYVVTTTFIVAIVDQLPGLEGKGSWTFMIIGVAAAPSAILWDLFARKFGNMNALICASAIQIVGILLPVIVPNLVFTMIGAILFGSTVIGMVSLVLTMAGRYYPTRPAKMMGRMTLSYGAAQIIAPAITGLMAERSGHYVHGLYLAAAMMIIGTALLLMLKNLERKEFKAQEILV